MNGLEGDMVIDGWPAGIGIVCGRYCGSSFGCIEFVVAIVGIIGGGKFDGIFGLKVGFSYHGSSV